MFKMWFGELNQLQITFSSLERYWQAMEDCGINDQNKPILKETSWCSKYSIHHVSQF